MPYTYPLEFKIKAIRRYEKGESIQSLCQELHIAQSTLYHWRKQFCSIMTPQRSYTPKEFDAISHQLQRLEHMMDVIRLSGFIPAVPLQKRLSVKDVQKVTGFSSSAVVGWISRNILKAFQPGKGYVIPKDFFVEFLISPYYRRIKNKTPIQRESLATFENLWLVRGGEQNAGSF